MVLKKVECDPKCGFSLQSHDEKEMMEFTKKHAKNAHDMNVSDSEIRKMMKTV